jgi:hypothetical protein
LFIESQELLSGIVNAAVRGGELRTLPDNVIVPFERLVKTLRDSEYIEVNPISHGKRRSERFSLSERSVKRIAEVSRNRVEKIISDVGFVTGLIEAPTSIRVASSHGIFSFPVSFSELRFKSSNEYKLGSLVAFSIVAQVDASGLIKSITRCNTISPAAEDSTFTKIKTRILRISELESGWLDGEGEPISPDAVSKAIDIAAFLCKKFSSVSVFPSPDGGLQFEWSANDVAVSLLVSANSFLFGASDLNSARFREKHFSNISTPFLRFLLNPVFFVGADHNESI